MKDHKFLQYRPIHDIHFQPYWFVFLTGFIVLFYFHENLLAQNHRPKRIEDKELQISGIFASTFLGGSITDDDYEPSIAIDQSGNVYITGYTYSSDFPTTPGTFCQHFNGGYTDRFVAKFSPDLSLLLASTFIGGSGEEYGMGLNINDNGEICIAGYTNSFDFPVTLGAFNETINGGMDGFVLLLTEDLSTLIASTFIGGTDDEGFQWPRIDLAIDNSNQIYVTGLTKSNDFPCTPGVFNSIYSGGITGGDIFVAIISPDLSFLISSTYLGGNMDEWRVSIVLDKDERVFICGETTSSDFPTTPNTYDPFFNGCSDVFISQFSNDLQYLLASTFLGSGSYEEALAIHLDDHEHVYITGYTMSPSFPVTPNAYNGQFNGGQRDAYVAKFDINLEDLLGSTFIGGSNDDTGEDIAISPTGDVFCTGSTFSFDFPTTPDAFDQTYNGEGDVFIIRLQDDLSALIAATFIGDIRQENGLSITVDPSVAIWIGGITSSENFPTSDCAYDPTYNGGNNDCFVVKIDSLFSGILTNLHLQFKGTTPLNVFPNPFHEKTCIKYLVNSDALVMLQIFDLEGNLVKFWTMENRIDFSHTIEWRGKDELQREVPAGIYFCRCLVGNDCAVQKIIKY